MGAYATSTSLLLVIAAQFGFKAIATEVPQPAAPSVTCTNTTCHNGGLCQLTASGGSFRCNCTTGYWGEYCERKRCVPGQYYDGECHSCPIGTYSPVQSLDKHCLPCPVDERGIQSTTNQAGRTDVSQCIYMPIIKRLRPDCGPVFGGTRVLIIFDYLNGRRPVYTELLGRRCTRVVVVDASTIMCETPNITKPSAGPILVRFGDETSALSSQNFTYRSDLEAGATSVSQCATTPVIRRLVPDYGPVSGGTRVYLDVEHLKGRQPVNAKLLGENCTDLLVVGESTIMCETPNVTNASAGHILVNFGDETSIVSPQSFTYRPDPVIRSIDNINTFISGGMVLRMHGEHLDSIFQPIMIVTRVYKNNSRVFTANHTKKTGTQLQFAIPKLTDGVRVVVDVSSSTSHESRRRRSALESNAFNSRDTHFYLGFRMDGVDEYRNMSTSPLPQYGELFVYNDPVYDAFEEDGQVRDFVIGKDEFIHIRGKHLNYACKIRDVTVTVGTEPCNITLLATNQLTCRPPARKPSFESSNYAPGGLPGVTVYVGTLVFAIGYLNYVERDGVSEVVIAVVVALAVAFVVVVGACLCFVRRRRRHAKGGTVRLRGLTQSHETNLYYVRGFFSNNPSGEYLTSQPAEHGSSLSLVTTSRGRTMSSSVTPPGTPLASSIYSGPYPNGTSIVLCNGSNTIFNIMDEIDEDTKACVEECLIDTSRLSLGEVIGQGYFGKVYRGELVDIDANIRRTVAVKTVHAGGHCTAKDLASFLSEAILMKDFNHPNVLSLLGLVISYNKPHVVLPFMQHGDLKTYIKSPSRSITVRELLSYGVQIANGMCYLAMQKFVHRDLATRNCMVDEELTVKIADFGLSRDVYRTDYYRVEDKHRPLPVRWMAIESLTLGVFTSKSDVWSYGVVLWELLTRGCSPYPDVDSFNIKSYVLCGRRMSQPHHAPDDVYALICRCWQDDPDDRPSFDELHTDLKYIIDKCTANNHHEYLQLVDL